MSELEKGFAETSKEEGFDSEASLDDKEELTRVVTEITQQEAAEKREELAVRPVETKAIDAQETTENLEKVRQYFLPSYPKKEDTRNLSALGKLSIAEIPSKEELAQYSKEQIISAAEQGLAGLWLDRDTGGKNIFVTQQLKEILASDPGALQRAGEMAIAAVVAEGQSTNFIRNIGEEAQLNKSLDEILKAPGMSSLVEQAAIKSAEQGDIYSAKRYFWNAPAINREEFVGAYNKGLRLKFTGVINGGYSSIHSIAAQLKEAVKFVPDEIEGSEAYQDVIQMIISSSLSYGDSFERMVQIREEFNIEEKQFHELITRALVANLNNLTERPILSSHKIAEALKLAKRIDGVGMGEDLLNDEAVAQASRELIEDLVHYVPKGRRDQTPLFSSIAEVAQKLRVQDKILDFTNNTFGIFGNKYLYDTAQSIYNDGAPSMGIIKNKELGLEQFRDKNFELKKEILRPDFDPKILQESDIYAQLYRANIRFEQSEFGSHGDDAFSKTVEAFMDLQEKGEIAPLPEEYEPSGTVLINKVDKDAQDKFEYSEQFKSRYDTLKSSLEDALALFGEKKPLTKMVNQVEERRTGVVAELESKLETLDNPKAKENLQKRIDNLKFLNLRSVKDFQNNFATLGQFKEFHKELRQSVFYFALQKRQNAQEIATKLVSQENPALDDVSSMINLVDHTINQETWKRYFTDKKAVKTFSEITSVKALEEEFYRAQNQESIGTTAVDFIPTRGLLMEFSGHIADACWASKYENIAKEFPNFSSIIMVQNRGTKNERLAGASMILETESEDGEKLLVIRGLNPIENLINTLKVEDFYDKFTSYLEQIAKKSGRRLAIVIDNHAGGSSTNRPALFDFLDQKSEELKKITLKSEEDTTFNGYNIVDNTYLV